MDIHESPVTACCYFANCPSDLMPAFYSVGYRQKKTGFSDKVTAEWLPWRWLPWGCIESIAIVRNSSARWIHLGKSGTWLPCPVWECGLVTVLIVSNFHKIVAVSGSGASPLLTILACSLGGSLNQVHHSNRLPPPFHSSIPLLPFPCLSLSS